MSSKGIHSGSKPQNINNFTVTLAEKKNHNSQNDDSHFSKWFSLNRTEQARGFFIKSANFSPSTLKNMPTRILFQQVASRYFAHSTVQFRSHYWGTLKKNILPSYLSLRLETDCCFRHHRPNASALHWSRAHFDVIWQCSEGKKVNTVKIKVENVYSMAFSTSNLQPTERPWLQLHRSVFVFNLC